MSKYDSIKTAAELVAEVRANGLSTVQEDICRALAAAVGDKALAAVPRELRDQVRAAIMKQVLILQV